MLRRRILLAGLAVLPVTLVTARPVSAHGAQGKMTLLRAEETAPGHAQIEVGLVYANDAEVAEEATVAVTLTGPDGSTVGPVPAPRTTGSHYVADVDLPAAGTWSFTVTAAAPAASVDGTVDIAPPATTTTAETTTTAAAGTSIVPVAASSTPTPASGPAGPSPALLAGVAVLAAAAVVVVGLLLNRRTQVPPETDDA